MILGVANNNDVLTPIKTDLAMLHGCLARLPSMPEGTELLTKPELKSLMNAYHDYASACVTRAREKAVATMDYIEAVQQHPEYLPAFHILEDDPAGRSYDYAGNQIGWLKKTLFSELASQVNVDEAREKVFLAERKEYWKLTGRFNKLAQQYMHDADQVLGISKHPPRDPDAPDNDAEARLFESFYALEKTSMAQMKDRLTIAKTVADILCHRKRIEFPPSVVSVALTSEFVAQSAVHIEAQIKTLNRMRNIEIAEDWIGNPVFPIIKQEPLDFPRLFL